MSALPRTYRIYSFDIDRRQVSADFLHAVDDEEVIGKAQLAGFGSKCEIWDGKRLVAQLETERSRA